MPKPNLLGWLRPTLILRSGAALLSVLAELIIARQRIPRLLILSLALVAPGIVAQTAVETPRTIRVVMDNAYAPYSFQSDEGKLQGILVDQWQAWGKKTGIKVEIHAMDWAEALRRMRAGEFDVIDSIVETAERRDYFDFTPAYTTIEASIYFRKDISGISDLASLKGFPVGVKTGDQHIDHLKANGVTTVILFQNNDAIIEAAKQHKINVFVVDNPSALYLLNKAGIEADFRHSAPVFRDELRRAVRKGDAAMLRMVSEGFGRIEPGELEQIDEKWFGRTINRYGRYLTYAAYAAAVAIVVIAALVGWNRTLRRRILQRTAALGESEQRFRQIAENIREVFWLSTADLSNTLYVSPAYENVWGRSRESLYQDPRSFFSAIHPEDRPHVISIVERDRERGFEVEYRVVRPDGSIRWIRDRGFPITDESGRFYRVAGIAEDITEHREAEALLHAKEQEFRAIVENAPDQIIRYDREFRRIYVNPAVAEFYGLPAETLIGQPLGSGIAKAGLAVKEDQLVQVRQGIAAVFNTGKPYDYELNWTMPTGQSYFSIRLFPEFDLNGSVVNVLGISRDITESKRAEEELKKEKEILEKIFDNIPVMIGFVGKDGAVKLVNPEWERAIGWTQKELQEQNVDIFAEAYPDLAYRQEVLDFVAASTGQWVDLKIKVRDGRVIDAACAVVHLSDGTKVAIAQDITERKRAEARIRATTEQLRALSASVQSTKEEEGTRIAREIHDELGGALTSLKWDLESFHKAISESNDQSLLQALHGKVEAMLRLSETTISAVRRISSELRPSVLDDLGLAAAIEWQARQFQTRTGIICHCECSVENLDLDQEQSTVIFRILQEALTNILRHAQATRVDIAINEEAGEIVLTVSDNGRGITEDEKSRLQSLGLLGMRERAYLIGGEIDIIGLAARGTVVTVRVPNAKRLTTASTSRK
jgi:PAS domain S-box-containing protein